MTAEYEKENLRGLLNQSSVLEHQKEIVSGEEYTLFEMYVSNGDQLSYPPTDGEDDLDGGLSLTVSFFR